MYYAQYDSPVGKLFLTCQDTGLTGIWYDKELPAHGNREDHPLLEQTKLWLDSYFRSEKSAAGIPMALQGTDFQKRVWKILMTIPWGETRTYGEIAREMAELSGKKSMSAQAVGQAVGRNPVNILIPCHRVVGAGGKLTGYAGGLERKTWLLRHEGRQIE